MLLTITTTHRPATDLGFLLHKHPARCQTVSMGFADVHVFYPEVSEQKCTAALLLDVDPIGLIRGGDRGKGHFDLSQYVNDRPYTCSSFMSVAIGKVFRTALNGQCPKHPELVDVLMPLSCKISMLPCRGGEKLLRQFFEPLGYTVAASDHALDKNFPDWGDSPYFTVELSMTATLKQLLNHLYVLIPALDNRKHYYIDDSEVKKLLKRGEGWLAGHEAKEIIARRFLGHQKSYTRQLLEQLRDDDTEELPADDNGVSPEETAEKELKLYDTRMDEVLAQLKAAGADSVIDLGCGDGKLLRLLLKDKSFKKITGMDVSSRSLEITARRLRMDRMSEREQGRISLFHGSLIYADPRFQGYHAAAVVEVVEHLDKPRLDAFRRVVFQYARPSTVVLTTPNREYNVMWPAIPAGTFRHGDHRFEWTREEFKEWAQDTGKQFGYAVEFFPVGKEEPNIGPPTQMAVFTIKEQETTGSPRANG